MAALKRMGSKLSFRSRSASRERQIPIPRSPAVFTNKPNGTEKPPDISMNLGGNTLNFGESGWQIENQELMKLKDENAWLRQELARSREEAEAGRKAAEESNLACFQNEVLIEMLAVSKLETKAMEEKLKREEVKVQEYKQELEKCLRKITNAGLGVESALGDSEIGERRPPVI
mmetsp:Transcript_18799/g.29412  ORF Transcript_18799/g.29412 Transcript_18799/m.29412 type:complete len:174 (-) Transcript_18799:130-651(-)